MTTNFKITFEGTEFEFITMNRVRLQLFQVYVLFERKKVRFHMQVNDNDEQRFYITDRSSCPKIYLPLESQYSEAILQKGLALPAI
ncbi:hypothetical protein [Mucilaginibacter sp. OK268]|jgi:hypothetical protein|uniref:hypothetical protein n=1 Tax=unclassified Mucilaginibacter TaxID=2617802 RepID=UPI00087EBA72|nr:hypothetical protein [Mucilaginibacter sp. OK268]SDP13353.1 hypothetical protein SAMN05428975_0428 [Mucilaginibacter sp. OK268]